MWCEIPSDSMIPLLAKHDFTNLLNVPRPEDAHSSEYVCSADERRSFLTGFSGSAGSALVTAEQAHIARREGWELTLNPGETWNNVA